MSFFFNFSFFKDVFFALRNAVISKLHRRMLKGEEEVKEEGSQASAAGETFRGFLLVQKGKTTACR